MGFNSIFFARIDYREKEQRKQRKECEMIWRPKQYDKDEYSSIFAHVLFSHYNPPPDTYFDSKKDTIPSDPIIVD